MVDLISIHINDTVGTSKEIVKGIQDKGIRVKFIDVYNSSGNTLYFSSDGGQNFRTILTHINVPVGPLCGNDWLFLNDKSLVVYGSTTGTTYEIFLLVERKKE